MTAPAAAPKNASSRSKIAIIAAAVMLIVGAVLAVVGVRAASDARKDVETNEAAVEDAKDDADAARDRLDDAERDRDAAIDRVDAATSAAETTLAEAGDALPIAGEIVQTDQRVVEILGSKSAAADAEDIEGFNALVDEFNNEVDTRNDNFNLLLDTLPGR